MKKKLYRWGMVLGAVMALSIPAGCLRSGEGKQGGAESHANGQAGHGAGETVRFYVGSSDGKLERPVFLVELDFANQRFAIRDSFGGAKGPSYLAFSPKGDFIYAIDKTVSDPATGHMSMASYRVDPQDQSLEFLNRVSSRGIGPCHLHCSNDGKYVFTANYTSGNVAVFPVDERGELLPASSVVQSSGSGPVENRQEGPHTHYVTLDSDEKFLLSPDLGSDKVLVYSFEPESGSLFPNPAMEFLGMPPGSGPRHLVFHPSGKFVYVVNELNATVTACSYNPGSGVLEILNTLSTVTGSHTGGAFPAAIRIHPEGTFLYASTRGDSSSIAVYMIGPDGRIERIQVVAGVPGWPRDFNIDPSGNYLVAAGERSGEIELYRIDRNTGFLQSTGIKTGIGSPGCILFINKT